MVPSPKAMCSSHPPEASPSLALHCHHQHSQPLWPQLLPSTPWQKCPWHVQRPPHAVTDGAPPLQSHTRTDIGIYNSLHGTHPLSVNFGLCHLGWLVQWLNALPVPMHSTCPTRWRIIKRHDQTWGLHVTTVLRAGSEGPQQPSPQLLNKSTGS